MKNQRQNPSNSRNDPNGQNRSRSQEPVDQKDRQDPESKRREAPEDRK